MNIWKDSSIEKERNERRGKIGRISFDCFSLRDKRGKAYCAKGHVLTEGIPIDTVLILKGMTSTTCVKCKDFEGGE